MAAKKKKNSKFGRNIPFGSRSALTVKQRPQIPDIDTGKMSRTVKTGEQMSQKERRAYISKVKHALAAKKPKKPNKKSHKARQNMPHYKYHP